MDEEAELAAGIAKMKEQLLIVFVRRLGGDITVPVAEVDDTGGLVMRMDVDQVEKTFRFVIERKQ